MSDDLTALPLKRETFCQLYVATGDAAKAARGARYSTRSAKERGYQLLQQPAVRARIAELQSAATARNETDADYVLTRAKDVYRLCMPPEKFDARGAVAALTLIAKLGGLFPEKPAAGVEVNTTGPVTVIVTHRVVDPVKQSPN